MLPPIVRAIAPALILSTRCNTNGMPRMTKNYINLDLNWLHPTAMIVDVTCVHLISTYQMQKSQCQL
jgi:hypothetical protein